MQSIYHQVVSFWIKRVRFSFLRTFVPVFCLPSCCGQSSACLNTVRN